MSKHIFITGTNTDVGKTYIGVRLIKELSKLGFIAFKPIETGCRRKNSKQKNRNKLIKIGLILFNI